MCIRDRGAYHAVHCRLRRPTLFAGAVGMGGIYDLTRFWGTDSDDMVPVSYTHLDVYKRQEMAHALALEVGDEVICIKKRILADTTPVIYSIDYPPVSYTHLDVYKRQPWYPPG